MAALAEQPFEAVHGAPESESRRRLLERLRRLAQRDTRKGQGGDEPPLISAFVARDRETISQLSMPSAGLVVVLEGRKEAFWGADRRVYEAGDAFILPAGARLDVVNEPDGASGVYRALFVRFSRPLIIEAARLWPHLRSSHPIEGRSVAVGPALGSAIVHAAEAVSGAAQASGRATDHRILEIILILAESGALPLAPKYVDGSVVEAVRLLVRHRLDQAWPEARVAAELSMSEATLRRRLREKGQTFRALLLSERMTAAHTILADRDADVADAVAAAGYASRSHFSRHFKRFFGVAPSVARRRGGKSPSASP
ncbi:AraC family transcriptional regulator [Roseiarcus fermentans]|uniref:AraC family transcriptional regulator n=1 Tax=Roseiarcus fermentans TaxID=1473586 RepID=A0A366FRZ6_9HYPH|nr:AraC family transcriptional regulator [Roseiarcus fermentans]RBP16830.1 AraC family transcriptional regulator [Roseiarcus fermentans]